MTTLVLAAMIVLLQDDAKVFVKDGRAPAVYYGWSPVLDYFGNVRKGIWTLRPDGVLYWGAPGDSFEEFAKRPLTAEEKKQCTTYEFRGGEFHFTYRDGSPGKGVVEYHPDGSIKIVKANILRYYPVIHGVPFELSGYWTCTTSYTGVAMTTTLINDYSFFKGGLFIFESTHSSIGKVVQERTYEHRSGDSIIQETIRSEVTRVHGASAPGKMGRYRVSGSALILEYDDGRKESRFIGTVPGLTGEQLVLIGGSLYTGTPGNFGGGSAPAPDAKPLPPAVPAAIKSPQFELQAPAGWIVREQEEDGAKLHFLLPPGVAKDDPFAIILLGSDLDIKITDPSIPQALEAVVQMLAKEAKIKPAGSATTLSIGGADALRATFAVDDQGKALVCEVTVAIRNGRAMTTIAIGSEAATKKHRDEARSTIALARLAAPPPVAKLAGTGFELDMPKGWKAAESEADGTKVTTLTPPGADVSAEYGVTITSSPLDQYKSATEKGAIAELRSLLKGMAPGIEPQGEPETFKAGGEPAAVARYAGRTADGTVVQVQGFMVVNHGKAVILIVIGTEKHVTSNAAAVRAGFESLRVKK